MAPFLRNGKCRRLSSHWLDVRLHFAFLYYITLGEGVNSLWKELRYRRIAVEKCLCHNRFSLRFHCGKGNRISHWKIRLLFFYARIGGGQNQQSGIEILEKKAVVLQSLFAPILLGEGYCIPPSENDQLMSTGEPSPHIESDFQLSNIPIPPRPKWREKVIAPQRLLGSKYGE